MRTPLPFENKDMIFFTIDDLKEISFLVTTAHDLLLEKLGRDNSKVEYMKGLINKLNRAIKTNEKLS